MSQAKIEAGLIDDLYTDLSDCVRAIDFAGATATAATTTEKTSGGHDVGEGTKRRSSIASEHLGQAIRVVLGALGHGAHILHRPFHACALPQASD